MSIPRRQETSQIRRRILGLYDNILMEGIGGANSSEEPGSLKNDRRLIKRLKRGDRAALRELYEQTFASLYRFVYFRAQEDHEVTQDVVHDTFLEAIKSLNNFSPDKGTIQAWLCGIARNRLHGLRRRAEKHAEAAQSLGFSRALLACDGKSSPEGCNHEVKAQVNDVLSLLPEKYTKILIKKYVDLKSVRDIAQEVGQSEKAVESLLTRARAAFRERFQAAQMDAEGEGYEF